MGLFDFFTSAAGDAAGSLGDITGGAIDNPLADQLGALGDTVTQAQEAVTEPLQAAQGHSLEQLLP